MSGRVSATAPAPDGPTPFDGFPPAALDFLDDLEADNSKTFWEAHREVYGDSVRGPMVALTSELAAEFGAVKIFRPHRDLRFAKDKTRPYKEQVSAFLTRDGHVGGSYVQLAASGLLVGVGEYGMGRDQVLRMREAIADDRRGRELERALARARKGGLALSTQDALKRPPKEHPADHPRVELLKLKSLTLMRGWPPTEPWLHTREALDRVREAWGAGKALLTWLDEHVGASGESPGRPR